MHKLSLAAIVFWSIQIAIFAFAIHYLRNREAYRSSGRKTSWLSKLIQLIIGPPLIYVLLEYISGMLRHNWKIEFSIFNDHKLGCVIVVSILYYIAAFRYWSKEE